MEELEIFTKESLIILQKYNQLIPLIKTILRTNDINTIEVAEGTHDVLINEFCNEQKISSDEKTLLKWLEDNKLTKEQLIEEISIPLRTIRFAKGKFLDQVNSYFLKKKDQLDSYIYSLIRVKDRNKAEEIFFRIQDEEESFADLASKYSEGYEKNLNGLVGPTSIINAHPKISEVLKSSSEGQLHRPISVDKWFIIIRLESYQPAILDKLMTQKIAIEIYEESLENSANSIAENILINKSSSIN